MEWLFIDIDETSARTIEDGVYPIVNLRYGTNFHHDTTFDYRDVFWDVLIENWTTVSLQRKIEIFYQAILQDSEKNCIRPVQWSVEKIRNLSSSYYIGMLSARHNELLDYTQKWVYHYYGNSVKKILFSNCYHGWKRRKPDICKDEWVKIMIEDDMDYALELAYEGISVFLLRKPWNIERNEKHKNIIRLNSWDELQL